MVLLMVHILMTHSERTRIVQNIYKAHSSGATNYSDLSLTILKKVKGCEVTTNPNYMHVWGINILQH